MALSGRKRQAGAGGWAAVADLDLRASFERDHRWLRLRLFGWVLLGGWQALVLASDATGLAVMRPVRLVAEALGLVGTVLIAVGFERIVREAHRRAGERPPQE